MDSHRGLSFSTALSRKTRSQRHVCSFKPSEVPIFVVPWY